MSHVNGCILFDYNYMAGLKRATSVSTSLTSIQIIMSINIFTVIIFDINL